MRSAAATNDLRLDAFTKILAELEERGMEHAGEVAARFAEPLQARFIDVKVSGSLNVAKVQDALGREASIEEGTYQLRGPAEHLPTAKPISWYQYGWLQFGDLRRYCARRPDGLPARRICLVARRFAKSRGEPTRGGKAQNLDRRQPHHRGHARLRRRPQRHATKDQRWRSHRST